MTSPIMSFPGPLGSKRRRMRSGGAASTVSSTGNMNETMNRNSSNDNDNDDIHDEMPLPEEENVSEQKTTQTSKCKGATTIPIFLKKTYKMVDTCDPSIASWTEEGDMFVVKDPDQFAKHVIPQYFDHNKFSSFARQLNFYGFRKMQSKPIRNSDFDAGTAKHVTFYNENFKKGRCDLLKKIQRSTRGGGALNPGDQSREVALLRDQVSNLEQQIQEVAMQAEERIRRVELDMLARMEQMMLAVQQQQRTQLQLEKATSVGTMNSAVSSQQSMLSQHQQQQQQQQQQLAQVQAATNAWDSNQYVYPNRATSVSSAINSVANAMGNHNPYGMPTNNNNTTNNNNNNGMQSAAPTLPPHPKQKLMPMGNIPGDMGAPPDRMNSLRGISTLSRGVSGLARGASVESSASAVLMRNSWEDKFFSMLMLDNNSEQNLTEANLSPTPINEGAPVTVSDTSIGMQGFVNKVRLQQLQEQEDLSDVSSGDLP